MVHQSCSIDETIGRIVRNTRVQDTAFIIDMHEWIPEAMDLMQTEQQYSPDYIDIDIRFHKGKLPCGLVYIEAVEYNGMRLPHGNSVKNIKTIEPRASSEAAFVSVPFKTISHHGFTTYNSQMVLTLPACTKDYYQLELGYILTSFETGCVRLHFKRTPVDSRGLPLIPDNGNYKEAIYWYVRGKMIEAGFNDKVMNWERCNAKFEFHAGRAVTEVDYPSPDQMESRIRTGVRFIAPQGYFENFFEVNSPEGPYNVI